MSSPKIIGHRGAARFYPENTLPSFTAGFQNTDAVEFDLWLSKDRIPFVFHDAGLERTTNGSGIAISKTLEELQKLDAGFRFDPRQDKSFPFRGQGVKIPSFENLLKAFPGKFWCVEIKQNSPELVHETVKLLQKYGCLKSCVIGSKHHKISETMKNFYPETPRFYSKRDMVLSYLDFKKGTAPKPDPFGTASMPFEKKCGMDFSDPGFIRFLHAKGVKVYFWTVNKPEEMRRLAKNGADGLITDDPALAAQTFKI